MKIPPAATKGQVDIYRDSFYQAVLRQCLISREDRKAAYFSLREKYMNSRGDGDSSEDEGKYRKIYAHLDQLSSFLYAQETTRFTLKLGADVDKSQYTKAPKLAEIVNDSWHGSNTDILYSLAINWALVYGSTFIKNRWFKGRLQSFMIEPHNFGVYREDVMGLEAQEAFVQIYQITKDELRRNIIAHPDKERIMKQLTASPKAAESSDGMTRALSIITTGGSPLLNPEANLNTNISPGYVPSVAADLVDMYELYMWDDEIDDWRVLTMADPDVVIYDRPIERIFMKGTHQFTQVCPSPMPTYFWGVSEVERLWPTQAQINQRIDEIRYILKKQSHPSKSFLGDFAGVSSIDDYADAFDADDGAVRGEIGSKVEIHQPVVPEDTYVWLDKLEMIFDTMSGLPPTLSGHGETGVRSKAHASELAKLGAARAKKRALIIEDGLDRQATLILKMHMVYDKTHYADGDEKDSDGHQKMFICNQLPRNISIKVDAHSNSPVFTEETKQDALILFKTKAIDRESLLDLMQPPMAALLINKLKNKIIPAEAVAAQSMAQHEDQLARIGKAPRIAA